ncbi:Hypothetical_protein [Hexamita inflata]|uniref:Hypothetical_protein n=1 Tax=Hexamita inflata TaxID=28002 RepID=A0AA86PJG7_9EUKA|nr:Hypothetical protein HINF_LOCUS27283 [Hexamita inflata]CAI9962947.1 Hypothetical protein HINF_LOCUS50592 [Hexamita inflata]
MSISSTIRISSILKSIHLILRLTQQIQSKFLNCKLKYLLRLLVSDNNINYQVASQLARNNLLLQLIQALFLIHNQLLKRKLQNQLLALRLTTLTTIIDESQLLTHIIKNNLFLNIKSQNNTPELYSENFLSTLNAFLEGNKCRKVTHAAEYVNKLINFSQKEETIKQQTDSYSFSVKKKKVFIEKGSGNCREVDGNGGFGNESTKEVDSELISSDIQIIYNNSLFISIFLLICNQLSVQLSLIHIISLQIHKYD